jgi:hypothetical protein
MTRNVALLWHANRAVVDALTIVWRRRIRSFIMVYDDPISCKVLVFTVDGACVGSHVVRLTSCRCATPVARVTAAASVLQDDGAALGISLAAWSPASSLIALGRFDGTVRAPRHCSCCWRSCLMATVDADVRRRRTTCVAQVQVISRLSWLTVATLSCSSTTGDHPDAVLSFACRCDAVEAPVRPVTACHWRRLCMWRLLTTLPSPWHRLLRSWSCPASTNRSAWALWRVAAAVAAVAAAVAVAVPAGVAAVPAAWQRSLSSEQSHQGRLVHPEAPTPPPCLH